MRPSSIASFVLASALVGAPALAQEPARAIRLPISGVDRPMVDPRGTLDLGGGIFVDRSRALLAHPPQQPDTRGGFLLYAGFSLTDDFSLASRLASVAIGTRTVGYLPTLGLTQRLVRGDFELGFGAGFEPYLKAYDSSGNLLRSASGNFSARVPLRVHLAHAVKVFFTPSISFLVPFASQTLNDTTFVEVDVPVAALIRITEPVAMAIGSGCNVLRLDRAQELTVIPVSLSATFTVRGPLGPMLDVQPSFGLPTLFAPGSSTRKVNPDLWYATLNFTGYVYR